jgi:hypothetical protein
MERREGMSIQIGQLTFETKKQAENHIRQILLRHRNLRFIQGPDREFAFALLDRHPRASLISDCGLSGIRVQSLGRGQYRFLAIRKDGSIRDFSWRNCVTPRSARAEVMSICRSVIIPQIQDFRNFFWNGKTIAICPISGESIGPSSSDVDHIPPDTFVSLVERWLSSIQMEPEEIEIMYKRGYESRSEFMEDWLEPDWAEFHQCNAKLRVVSIQANRSILRRGSSC